MILRAAWFATGLVLLWNAAALGIKRLHDRASAAG